MLKVRLNLRKVVAIAICLAGFTVFSSCDKDDKEPPQDPLAYDDGVVINGVKWATRNVNAPGFFVANPEDVGMLYQWNRKKAWTAIGDVISWDATTPEGNIWEKANDPSPKGWRVPTLDEIKTLFDFNVVSNEWTIENGRNGRKFTDKATNNILFLPAVSYRYDDGKLYGEDGTYGLYWSSTASESEASNAYAIEFYNLYAGSGDHYRYRNCGFSVRAVAE